jgi:hypothetical protein
MLAFVGAFVDALDAIAGPMTRVLMSCEQRWSLRECLDIVEDRGWECSQVGGTKQPTDAQLDWVPKHVSEMGTGHCFVYSLARRSTHALAHTSLHTVVTD